MSRLDCHKAAAYIPCAKSTLDKLRTKGGGPRFIQLGRKILYDTVDLDEWLEARKRLSTADPGTGARARRRRGAHSSRRVKPVKLHTRRARRDQSEHAI